MRVLLVVLYLLPLIPVYIQLDALWSFAITLICLAILKFELNRQSALQPFSSIQVNEKETWHLIDSHGKLQPIILKNFMWFGTVLFLLFTLNGKRQRVMVFGSQQQTAHLHKLKVYLRNI